MHPLTLWLTSVAELGERERERALLGRQRESRGEETPLQRDGRWAATMHRWADQSHRAPAAGTAAAAPSAAPAFPAPALPAAAFPAAAPAARLGCA
jgi:hypothetical protein